MYLCCSCRFVSPAGSLRCGKCGRSFGGRLCPRHHLSPAGSQFCVQCGSQELIPPTLGLPLGCFSRLLAWGGVLLLISLVSHQRYRIASLLWGIASWGLIHILGISPCTLMKGLLWIIAWIVALNLLSGLIPGPFGLLLRSLVSITLRIVGISARLVMKSIKWVYHAVEGVPATSATSEKKKHKL